VSPLHGADGGRLLLYAPLPPAQFGFATKGKPRRGDGGAFALSDGRGSGGLGGRPSPLVARHPDQVQSGSRVSDSGLHRLVFPIRARGEGARDDRDAHARCPSPRRGTRGATSIGGMPSSSRTCREDQAALRDVATGANEGVVLAASNPRRVVRHHARQDQLRATREQRIGRTRPAPTLQSTMVGTGCPKRRPAAALGAELWPSRRVGWVAYPRGKR
jgi:hypothetical protein